MHVRTALTISSHAIRAKQKLLVKMGWRLQDPVGRDVTESSYYKISRVVPQNAKYRTIIVSNYLVLGYIPKGVKVSTQAFHIYSSTLHNSPIT